MTWRLLPPEEWSRLDETTSESVWRSMSPRFSEVIVVEDQGKIVACLLLLSVIHAECAMNLGGSAAGRALWEGLQSRVEAHGVSAVWGSALDESMNALLSKHGDPIPGMHFIVGVSPCLH